MITVETWDGAEGTWIRVTGHAGQPNVREHIQVCAAVGSLMGALVAICDVSDVRPNKGELDGTGYMQCYVPGKYHLLLEFVVGGIGLIANEYSGYVQFERRDSILFLSEETRQWKPEEQLMSVR